MEAANQSGIAASAEGSDDADDGALLESVARWLWQIMAPIIIVVGLLGNLMVVIVFSRLQFSKSSTLTHMFVLAITDSVILCLGPTRHWAINMWDFDVRVVSDAGCKIHLFLLYTTLDFSAWILVSVTVERALSVLKPLHVRGWFTVKRTLIRLAVILLLLGMKNGHFLVSNGLVLDEVVDNTTSSVQSAMTTASTITLYSNGDSNDSSTLDFSVTLQSKTEVNSNWTSRLTLPSAASNTLAEYLLTSAGVNAVAATTEALEADKVSISALSPTNNGAVMKTKPTRHDKKGSYNAQAIPSYSCDSLTDGWKHFEEFYFVYIDMCVESFFPFVVMAICNCFIIRSLRKALKNKPRRTTKRELMSLASTADCESKCRSRSSSPWSRSAVSSRSSSPNSRSNVTSANRPTALNGRSNCFELQVSFLPTSVATQRGLANKNSPNNTESTSWETAIDGRCNNGGNTLRQNGHVSTQGALGISSYDGAGAGRGHCRQDKGGKKVSIRNWRSPIKIEKEKEQEGNLQPEKRRVIPLWKKQKQTLQQSNLKSSTNPSVSALLSQSETNSKNSKELKDNSSTSVTRMLVLVTTVFVIATLPACMYYVLDTYLWDNDDEDAYVNKALNVTQTVTSLLQYSNYGCNFLLYSFHSKRFLREVTYMLGLAKGRFLRHFNSSMLSHERDRTTTRASRSRHRYGASTRSGQRSTVRAPPLPSLYVADHCGIQISVGQSDSSKSDEQDRLCNSVSDDQAQLCHSGSDNQDQLCHLGSDNQAEICDSVSEKQIRNCDSVFEEPAQLRDSESEEQTLKCVSVCAMARPSIGAGFYESGHENKAVKVNNPQSTRSLNSDDDSVVPVVGCDETSGTLHAHSSATSRHVSRETSLYESDVDDVESVLSLDYCSTDSEHLEELCTDSRKPHEKSQRLSAKANHSFEMNKHSTNKKPTQCKPTKSVGRKNKLTQNVSCSKAKRRHSLSFSKARKIHSSSQLLKTVGGLKHLKRRHKKSVTLKHGPLEDSVALSSVGKCLTDKHANCGNCVECGGFLHVFNASGDGGSSDMDAVCVRL